MTAPQEVPAAPKASPRGLRQSMSDLHIWVGLLAGWLLYAMFLTGTVSYFREEISQWARPEVAAWRDAGQGAAVADRLGAEMTKIAPHARTWFLVLPDARRNVAEASWRGRGRFEHAQFDPATGARLTARETEGGDFFYEFHFNLHYVPVLWGRWIVGVAAMFMLVAIVAGVITHAKIFADFFTFRWGKGQRSWLDAHNGLSVLGLPFHLMITYTGLVMLVVLYMPWGMKTPSAGPKERAAIVGVLRGTGVRPSRPRGVPAPLAPLGPMVQKAEAQWRGGHAGRIQVNNPGDAAAQVVVVRRDSEKLSTSAAYVVFDGVSGKAVRSAGGAAPAAETYGVMYGLHMGRFADLATRWLYFLVSLGGTAMVGTGLVLWTVKRRARLADPDKPYFGFRLVERLNIAAIAGLPLAMTAFLWSNRLLPTRMAARADWEIHLFFIVWTLTLGYAALRPPKRAWVELLWATSAALALVPLLDMLTTNRGLPASLAAGDWVFVGFDLALLAFAALAAALARRTALHKPRAAKRRVQPAMAVKDVA